MKGALFMNHRNKGYIMAFGAHADDMDIRAGGTVKKFLDSGYKLIEVLVTTSAGGTNYPVAEGFCIRQKELRSAAKMYNAKLLFLNLHQSNHTQKERNSLPKNLLKNKSLYQAAEDPEYITKVSKLIMKYSPKIIFTHYPDDFHSDHYQTSKLVVRAFNKIKMKINVELWLWENGGRGSIAGFMPNKYINIKKYIALKQRIIDRHVSQCEKNPKFKTYAMSIGKRWGEKCNLDYAEPFFVIKNET